MCIWDSYVYQKGVLRFLIAECYIRAVKRYCFVRQCAAVPVQLEIVILQYIGWCVLIYYYYYYYYYYYSIVPNVPVIGGSLSPRHGTSSGCG